MNADRTRWGLALLFFLAVALRLTTVGLVFDADRPAPAFEHGEIARNLIAGRGFRVWFLGQEGPTSQQAPLFPALLGACYRLCGPETAASVWIMQGLQCLAGGVLALLVVRLAWRLLPNEPHVGWCAGLWAACDPAQVYLVTHLQVAVWAALSLTATTYAALGPWTQSRARGAALGAGAGVMLLIEPIYAIVLPGLALAAWLRAGRTRQIIPAGLAAALTLAVVLSPWLIRNRLVHGEWVFVKSTFGYALWQGNNPLSHGTDKIPKPSATALLGEHDGSLRGQHAAGWAARRETLYIDDALLKPSSYCDFAGLSEPRRSALLGERAGQFIRQHRADYLRLCGRRLRYFLLFDETNPKASHPVFRASTVVWLTLTSVGLLATGRRWRALWPLAATFTTILAFHCLTITSVRFRLAAQPLAFAFTALAVAPPLVRIGNRARTAWENAARRSSAATVVIGLRNSPRDVAAQARDRAA